jgi:hypothetical protein
MDLRVEHGRLRGHVCLVRGHARVVGRVVERFKHDPDRPPQHAVHVRRRRGPERVAKHRWRERARRELGHTRERIRRQTGGTGTRQASGSPDCCAGTIINDQGQL